jgi:hypothetical protein
LVSNPLCLSSSSALHFFRLFFLVHHFVNQDDQHLLTHAMASDFSVAWQCLSKRTIGFFFVTDQTPRPSNIEFPKTTDQAWDVSGPTLVDSDLKDGGLGDARIPAGRNGHGLVGAQLAGPSVEMPMLRKHRLHKLPTSVRIWLPSWYLFTNLY